MPHNRFLESGVYSYIAKKIKKWGDRMLEQFPQVIYKGNSINSSFGIIQKDTEYVFREGDIILLGIKNYVCCKNYIYHKKFNAVAGEKTITIEILPNETREMKKGKAVLELTLINGNLEKTLYQEQVEIKEVVNNERI